jgi:hypothetical protein
VVLELTIPVKPSLLRMDDTVLGRLMPHMLTFAIDAAERDAKLVVRLDVTADDGLRLEISERRAVRSGSAQMPCAVHITGDFDAARRIAEAARGEIVVSRNDDGQHLCAMLPA